MTEYTAFIANCLIHGELPTEVEAGRVLNLIKLQLDGLDLQLVEHPEFITQSQNQFDGTTRHTTNLTIAALNPTDFDRAQALSHEVARLLAFATSSEVWDFGYFYPEVNPAAVKQRVMGRIHIGVPVIDTSSGSTVREFLQQTWPAFHALRPKFRPKIGLSTVEKPCVDGGDFARNSGHRHFAVRVLLSGFCRYDLAQEDTHEPDNCVTHEQRQSFTCSISRTRLCAPACACP